MLIIEKTAVTLGEKEEMNDILSKCQSLKGEYTDISQCLDELVERHNELKAKKYRQAIVEKSAVAFLLPEGGEQNAIQTKASLFLSRLS